jgi:hypothetical protein
MATVEEAIAPLVPGRLAIRRTRGVRGPAGSAPSMMGSSQIHQKRMLADANYHRTGVVTQVSLWYGSGIAS